MNQKKELLKNTFMIAFGKSSTQVISFLLLPLYTSILSTSEYGNYDLLNTLSIFIIPFITLLIEEAMFRFLIDAKNDEEKSEVISHAVIVTLTNMVIGAGVIYLFGTIFNYPYTVYLIFFVLASILSTLAGSCSRGQGDYKLYSIFASLSSLFTVILNVVFIAILKWGVVSLFLAYIIANASVSIWLLLKMNVHKLLSFKKINKSKLKEMLKYSIPLVPNSVSWIIINLSDRLIIVTFINTAANGIYAISNKFSTIINTFYSFFYMAWKESASKVFDKEDKDKFYNNIYINLKHLLMAVSIGMLAYLPFVFPVLVNKEYYDAYQYIPILILAVYFNNISSYCGGIFAAYKDTNTMGLSTLIAAIINIVVNISLVKHIGLYAAVISTLVASYAVYLYRIKKMKKFLILDKDKYGLISGLVFGFLLLTYYSDNLIIYIVGVLVGTIYPVYLNLNIVKAILNKVFNKRVSQ